MRNLKKVLLLILILCLGVMVFVGCDDDSATPATPDQELAAPTNVAISDGLVTWDANPNASGYQAEVTYKDKDNIVETQKHLLISNKYQLDFKDGSADFRVYAVANTGFKNSPFSAVVSATKLDAPTRSSLSVASDILKWGAIEGANGYRVYIGTSVFETITNQIDLKTTNLASFDNIAVQAKGGSNSLSSEISGRISPMVLDSLDLTFTNTKASWNLLDANDVKEYKISFNGKTEVVTSDKNEYDLAELLKTPGKHTITVKAISKNAGKVSTTAQEVVEVVPAPTMKVVDGKLVFENIGDAKNMELEATKVGTTNISVIDFAAGTTYNGTQLGAGEWDLRVRIASTHLENKNYFGSAFSNKLSNITKLETSVLSQVGSKITWTTPTDKTGLRYTYFIDGKKMASTTQIGIDLDTLGLPAGSHDISVVIGKGNALSSNESGKVTFTCLNAPQITAIQNEIIYWNAPVTGGQAIKYYARIDGSEHRNITSDVSVDNGVCSFEIRNFSLDAKTAGLHRFTVYAKGDGVNTLVRSVEGAVEYKVLTSPDVSVTADGLLNIANSEDAKLRISNGGYSFDTYLNKISLTDLTDGDQNVSVIKIGNGSDRFTSEPTVIAVNKLAKPTSLAIKDGATLEWKVPTYSADVQYEVEARNNKIKTDSDRTSCSIAEYFNIFKDINNVEFKVRTVPKNATGGKVVASDWITMTTNTAEGFYGGSGTEAEPFVIANYEHLKNIATQPNSYFLLLNNIYCVDDIWESLNDFKGKINGANYTIYNMNIQSNGENLGFIGSLGMNGGVKNLNFDSVKAVISDKTVAYAGIIVGKGNSSDIENCSVVNSLITVNNSKLVYAGGAVGYTEGNVRGVFTNNVEISFINTKGNVTSPSQTEHLNAGGVIGWIDGNVSSSYADAIALSFSGNWGMQSITAGGAIGYIHNNKINKVDNVYAVGSIGIRGDNKALNIGGMGGVIHSEVDKSYANISIDIITGANEVQVGGFIASVNSAVSKSYSIGKIKIDLSKKEEVKNEEKNVKIAGFISDSRSSLTNAYSQTAIEFNNYASVAETSTLYIGGLAAVSKGVITNCYASNPVKYTSDAKVSIASLSVNHQSDVVGTYVNADANSHPDIVTGGAGKAIVSNTSSMRKEYTYEGWDFSKVWFCNGSNLPTLL